MASDAFQEFRARAGAAPLKQLTFGDERIPRPRGRGPVEANSAPARARPRKRGRGPVEAAIAERKIVQFRARAGAAPLKLQYRHGLDVRSIDNSAPARARPR